MSLKKIERVVALMKAQVSFIATRQKGKKSVNKNIIAYSKNVTDNTLKVRTPYPGNADKPGNASGSKLTFQVYSHLISKEKDSL